MVLKELESLTFGFVFEERLEIAAAKFVDVRHCNCLLLLRY